MAFNHPIRPLTVISVMLLTAGVSFAAAPAPDKVFEENTKALGGETAIRAIKSRFYDGTMDNKRNKTISRITSWQKAPNQSYTEIESLGIGTFVQGYDGAEAWSFDGHSTVKVLTGPEAAAVADAAILSGDLDWKTRYSEAKTVGETTFESKPAVEIAVTTTQGAKKSIFFDPKTWLQLGVREPIPGPASADPKAAPQFLTTTYDEYREVAGVKTVTKFTQKVGEMEIVSSFKTVEANVDVKVSFAKPVIAAKKTEATPKTPAVTDPKTDKKDAKK